MRGTWQTTGGDDGIQSVAYCLVAGVLVMAGASWVLRHMLWIAIPAGVILVVAAAGLVWWMRGTSKRKAEYAARYAVAFARHRAVTVTAAPQVSPTVPPAIEQHIHYHYHAADGQEPVRAIIPGKVLP